MSDPLLAYRLHARTRQYGQRRKAAISALERAAAMGRPLVCSSWGKDSVVLVDLACEVYGQSDVVYLRSPAALPGVERVIDAYRPRITYHEVRRAESLADYIAWVRDVGLPHERTASGQAKAVASIKADPAEEWMVAHRYDVLILGMRAEESVRRARLMRTRGSTYRRANGRWVANPLASWTARDVWAHIADRGLTYHRELYDAETHGETRETLRNLGWLSTDGAERGRVAWLRAHFPQLYHRLREEFPEITRYS